MRFTYEELMEPRMKTVLEAIVCNVCGFKIEAKDWVELTADREMHHLSGDGGFNSNIGDCVEWEMDICDNCLKEIFRRCKIPVPMRDEKCLEAFCDKDLVKTVDIHGYRVFVEKDGDGFYAHCYELSGLYVGGDMIEETIQNAKDGVEAYLLSLMNS